MPHGALVGCPYGLLVGCPYGLLVGTPHGPHMGTPPGAHMGTPQGSHMGIPDGAHMGTTWGIWGPYQAYWVSRDHMGPMWAPYGLSGAHEHLGPPYGHHMEPRYCATWVPPSSVPCRMVFAKELCRVTWPYHIIFFLLTVARRGS